MTHDRRSFLRLAGAMSTAAVAGVGASLPAAAARSPAGLTRSAFASAVGDEFVFEQQVVAEVAARLVKVQSLPAAKTAQEAEHRFRAVFAVDSSASLKSGTYRVRHAGMGEFALFVSPNSPQGDIVEAVFNRA